MRYSIKSLPQKTVRCMKHDFFDMKHDFGRKHTPAFLLLDVYKHNITQKSTSSHEFYLVFVII